MMTRHTINSGLALATLLVCISAPALADRDRDRGRKDDGRGNDRVIHIDRPARVNPPARAERRPEERVIHREQSTPQRRSSGRVIHIDRAPHNRRVIVESKPRVIKRETHLHYQNRGWMMDRRYNHNHYYPPRGHVVHNLPPRRHVVRYRGAPYYFWGGVWYRPYNSRFVVALPPIGIRVRWLPEIYTTIWFAGIPYYYAGGVYYVYDQRERDYVVTKPPSEIASLNGQTPVNQDQLFMYPKQGQSEEQQARDRYECHRWAVSQTGYDPTAASANLSVSEQASKRIEYNRAMKACLEGRGYSVQ